MSFKYRSHYSLLYNWRVPMARNYFRTHVHCTEGELLSVWSVGRKDQFSFEIDPFSHGCIIFSRETNSRIANVRRYVCLSVSKTPQPLRIRPISQISADLSYYANKPSCHSAKRAPSQSLKIITIGHHAHQPSSPSLAIISHHAFLPSYLLSIFLDIKTTL